MQPVRIVISKNSDTAALRAECTRLGIDTSITAKPSRLRTQLRTYKTQYNNWLRQRDLAERLFGTSHGIDTRSPMYIVHGMCDQLFQRLMCEGYVHAGGVDGGGLYDAKSGDTIYILARKNGSNARIKRVRDGHVTTNDGAAIIYLARLAFQDVDKIYCEWEEAGKKKKSKRTAE